MEKAQSNFETRSFDNGENAVTLEIIPGIFVLLDSADVPKVMTKRWRIFRRDPLPERIFFNKGRQKISLARFLWGESKADFICFKDPTRRRDFRRSNLMECTSKERQQQLGKQSGLTSSAYKGVYWCRRLRKWRATIEVDGIAKALGSFESEEQAALAYNAAVEKYFSPVAALNKIESRPSK